MNNNKLEKGECMQNILSKFSLEGKVAIVTGASRGLGQGIAVGLASAGADIVGVGSGDMPETARLVEEQGRKFHAIKANLISQEPINQIIEETKRVFGKIDILINNAGIIRREDALEFNEHALYYDSENSVAKERKDHILKKLAEE